jgi:hypothetical protein
MLGITHQNLEAEELPPNMGQSIVIPDNRREDHSAATPNTVETEADKPEKKKVC